MSNPTNIETVTIQFTVAEANWLVAKLAVSRGLRLHANLSF